MALVTSTLGAPEGLLASYRPDAYDELLSARGAPHTQNLDLASTINVLGLPGLLARRTEVDRVVEDDGVTYHNQRSWHLDPIPIVLDAGAWSDLAEGLVQRAELLDAILTDLYGPRMLLRRRLVPPEAVLRHPEYLRVADHVRLPGSRQLFMSATDLARDDEGTWRVLSDRTQAPSGAGYAMENRRVVSRVMPGLYRGSRPERLRKFFHTMRAGLYEVAPPSAQTPNIVLLTPGPDSETAFDQSFVSTVLGCPMVTGSDLTVRHGRVYLRALSGLEPVDVIVRRVDSSWADPLELNAGSRLGVAGLLEAARLGNVSVVNPLGSGILENTALLPFMPEICRALLGEDLRLPTTQTFWCGDPASLSHVKANLESLVVKPTARSNAPTGLFGWELSTAQRESLIAEIEADPTAWAAQVPVQLSTAPIVTPHGLEARKTVLRTFAVAAGGHYELMAGGLARTANRTGHQRVSNEDGALAKDVWVLTGTGAPAPPAAADPLDSLLSLPLLPASREPALPSRTAEDLFWLGRYSERAEQATRFVRVTDDLVEDHGHRPGTSGAAGLRVMLEALTWVTATFPGFTASEQLADPTPEILSLVVAAHRPGSIAHAARRTTALAQSLREQLSMDTWVVLGDLDRVLDELGHSVGEDAQAVGIPLQPRLTRVLEGLLALSGLQAESLVRDTGWYFLDAGRRLERTLGVLSLLRRTQTVARRPAIESFVQEAVLTIAESVITHRRRFAARLGGEVALAGLLELLLQDAANPRSVAYQLERLTVDLGHLPQTDAAAAELGASVRDALAKLRELPRNRDGLGEALDGLLSDVRTLAVQFERVYFTPPVPQHAMENQQARQAGGRR